MQKNISFGEKHMHFKPILGLHVLEIPCILNAFLYYFAKGSAMNG